MQRCDSYLFLIKSHNQNLMQKLRFKNTYGNYLKDWIRVNYSKI